MTRSTRPAASPCLAILLIALTLASCSDIFGPFENVADPKSSNYQGYELVAVRELSLDRSAATCPIGYDFRLEASITPVTATDNRIIWASSDTAIATVTSCGIVSAKALGHCSITATSGDGGHQASCALTVDRSAPSYQTPTPPAAVTDLAIYTDTAMGGSSPHFNFGVAYFPVSFTYDQLYTYAVNYTITSLDGAATEGIGGLDIGLVAGGKAYAYISASNAWNSGDTLSLKLVASHADTVAHNALKTESNTLCVTDTVGPSALTLSGSLRGYCYPEYYGYSFPYFGVATSGGSVSLIPIVLSSLSTDSNGIYRFKMNLGNTAGSYSVIESAPCEWIGLPTIVSITSADGAPLGGVSTSVLYSSVAKLTATITLVLDHSKASPIQPYFQGMRLTLRVCDAAGNVYVGDDGQEKDVVVTIEGLSY